MLVTIPKRMPDRAAAIRPSPTTRTAGPPLRTEVAPILRLSTQTASANGVQLAALQGVQTPSGQLPFAEQIQRSFGRFDVSQIRAHQGPEAAASAFAMGAAAYATGDHVVFGATPSLKTAAHEAAHVVQQRAGVHLPDGVGLVGDVYERHADAVADKVLRGESAEDLLTPFAPPEYTRPVGPGASPVQRVGIGGWLLGTDLDTTLDKNKDELTDYFEQTAHQGPTYAPQLFRDLKAIVAEGGKNSDYYEALLHRLIEQVQSEAVQEDPNYGGQNVANCTLYVDGLIQNTMLKNYVSNQRAYPGTPYQHANQPNWPEMRMSSKDSEVPMLNETEVHIMQSLHQVKNSIAVKIVSKNGPCDGCKQRIQYFLDRIKTAWNRLGNGRGLSITVSYTYLELPKSLVGARTGSTYGYQTERYDLDVLGNGKMVLNHNESDGVFGDVEMGQDPDYMEQHKG